VKEIINLYHKGQGIVSLSQMFDVAPVAIARNVLSNKNWRKNRVKAVCFFFFF